jgi:hypothetical protein
MPVDLEAIRSATDELDRCENGTDLPPDGCYLDSGPLCGKHGRPDADLVKHLRALLAEIDRLIICTPVNHVGANIRFWPNESSSFPPIPANILAGYIDQLMVGVGWVYEWSAPTTAAPACINCGQPTSEHQDAGDGLFISNRFIPHPLDCSATRWIPVAERWPEPHSWFTGLIIGSDLNLRTNQPERVVRMIRGYPKSDRPQDLFPEMTHWCPLPELPQ